MVRKIRENSKARRRNRAFTQKKSIYFNRSIQMSRIRDLEERIHLIERRKA
tara:strand:+ start:1082 stop:1234 length:153 start_codon:yes stop_codon:yes gene_type:complete